jgi:hypothetical protein
VRPEREIDLPNYPRKRDKVEQNSPLDLPRLTVKQTRFVQALLAGNTTREAYKLAFNCSKMKDTSISAAASELLGNHKIATYIRAIQRMGFEQASITRENHLAELARMREIAIENQQVSAGVQAEHYRGRVAGLYNDKLSLTVGPSDEALLAQLGQMLGEETKTLIEQALDPAPVTILDGSIDKE